MEALIAEYPPKYSLPISSHEGEEFGCNRSGQFLLLFDEEEHVPEEGDMFRIDSDRPYTVPSLSDRPDQILCVQTLKLLR